MISAISRFRVRNGMEKDVERAFLDRPHLVDHKPGFLGMESFTDAEDAAVVYLVTRWTDAASYRAWHSSPARHELHSGFPQGLTLDAEFTPVTPLHRSAESLIGESSHPELRQLQEQLVLLHNELAVSLRENERKSKVIAASSAQLQRALEELQSSHWHLKKIQEVLPICMSCGKVRVGAEGWAEVVDYLKENALFLSHTYCPECAADLIAANGLDVEATPGVTPSAAVPDASAPRAGGTAPRSSRR